MRLSHLLECAPTPYRPEQRLDHIPPLFVSQAGKLMHNARAKPAPLPSDSQDFFQKKHLYVQPKARQANVFASCFAISFISFQYFYCTSSFSHSPINLQASPSTIPASLISHLPRPHFSSNTLLPKSIVISIPLLNPSASR